MENRAEERMLHFETIIIQTINWIQQQSYQISQQQQHTIHDSTSINYGFLVWSEHCFLGRWELGFKIILNKPCSASSSLWISVGRTTRLRYQTWPVTPTVTLLPILSWCWLLIININYSTSTTPSPQNASSTLLRHWTRWVELSTARTDSLVQGDKISWLCFCSLFTYLAVIALQASIQCLQSLLKCTSKISEHSLAIVGVLWHQISTIDRRVWCSDIIDGWDDVCHLEECTQLSQTPRGHV